MTTSNRTTRAKKQLFRSILVFALTASATMANAQIPVDPTPRDTISSANDELPVYPFAPKRSEANQKALAKLLGLSTNGRSAVTSGPSNSLAPAAHPTIQPVAALPRVNSASSQSTQPVSNGIAYSESMEIALKMIQHPGVPMEDASSGVQQSPHSTGPFHSMVVQATGTAPSRQGFEERFSDAENTDTPSGQDLVNSLDLPISSPPVERPSMVPEDSVSQHLTDSVQSVVEHQDFRLSDQHSTELEPNARQPQLVKVHQGMSVQSGPQVEFEPIQPQDQHVVSGAVLSESSSRSVGESVQAPLQITMSSPRGEVQAPALLPPATVPPMSYSKVSQTAKDTETMRRELKPLPMQVRVEGDVILNRTSKSVGTAMPISSKAVSSEAKQRQLPVPAKIQPASASISKPVAAQTTPKIVSVGVKESVTLDSTHLIGAVSVENTDVCQVIQRSGQSVSVIGLREGETRIALISDTKNGREVEIHRVSVQGLNNASQSNFAEISQTVQRLFPRSRVRIQSHGEQIVVSGIAESEDAAKKILNLVRKSTLTPVIDELSAR